MLTPVADCAGDQDCGVMGRCSVYCHREKFLKNLMFCFRMLAVSSVVFQTHTHTLFFSNFFFQYNFFSTLLWPIRRFYQSNSCKLKWRWSLNQILLHGFILFFVFGVVFCLQ